MIGSGAFSNPLEIAKEGERIYAEKYREEYEAKFSGQFAVIEVKSGEIFPGRFPEDAIDKARLKFPDGMLHLIRIGSPSAYQVSFLSSSHERLEWAVR